MNNLDHEAKKKALKNIVQKRKLAKVLHEFKTGSLKSSSGKKVMDKAQALAIGFSEARRS